MLVWKSGFAKLVKMELSHHLGFAEPYHTGVYIYTHTHTFSWSLIFTHNFEIIWLNLTWVHTLKHAWHMSRVMEGALLRPFIPQLCWHIQITANSNPKTVFSPLSLSSYHVCIIETILFCSYRLPHGWPGVGGLRGVESFFRFEGHFKDQLTTHLHVTWLQI